MNNYIKKSNQMKEFLMDFGLKISKRFHKPKIKFICEMIFGIASSKSIHITRVARSLKEEISIKETANRLYENLNALDYDSLWSNYRETLKPCVNENTLFHIDNTDVIKPFGTYFEDLGKVKDGSSKDGKIEKGYPVTEITALFENTTTPVSVYSKIFSNISKEYTSDNEETDKALDSIYNAYGNVGTVVMDRGYDDKKRFEYFINKNWNFIIRGKKNRNLYYNGKEYTIKEFTQKYKGKINITIHLKNKVVNRKASYFKVKLKGMKEEMYVIFVYFKDEVAIFYTNKELKCKKDVINVVTAYYKRWRIEEYFKFKKQEYGFEDFRVRSMQSMNALNTLLSMAINAIASLCEKETNLAKSVIECSKPVKEKVYFKYYRVSDGVYFLLSQLKVALSHIFRPKEKERQLQLFSILDGL